MSIDLSVARLSLATSPFLPSSDVNGASTLYFTDGVTWFTESGPWSVGVPRDVFFNGSAIQSAPWQTRNGALPTSSFGAYIGSINPDQNGLLNCHPRVGANRRWDVWNAKNKEDICLQVADGSSNIAFSTSQANWTPVTPGSAAEIIIGLPQNVDCRYEQSAYTLAGPSGGSAWAVNGIGWGAAFATPVPWTWPNIAGQPPGKWGQTGEDNYSGGAEGPSTYDVAEYTAPGFVGAQTIYAVVCANTVQGSGSVVTYMGKNPPVERDMEIRFRG